MRFVVFTLIINFYQFHMLCFVVFEFTGTQINTHVLYLIKYTKFYFKFQQSLWKLYVKPFFLSNCTVCRPANDNKFLQKNFSEIKFKMHCFIGITFYDGVSALSISDTKVMFMLFGNKRSFYEA